MCREKIQAAVLASYADELERAKLPGYVSRYDDLDAEYDVPVRSHRAGAHRRHGGEPPLRRGPLRGHTQHVARRPVGPPRARTSPPRKESSPEGIASDRGESRQGFGSGL